MKSPADPARRTTRRARPWPGLLVILCCMGWIPRVEARPGNVDSDRLAVPGNSGVMTLPVHESLMTLLHFPEPIERLIRSDEKNFVIGARGTVVGVRPMPDAKVGTQASLAVITRTMRLSVRLQVVENPDDADLQVSFVPYIVDLAPDPPLKSRLSFQLAGTMGRAWSSNNTTEGEISAVYVGGLSARLRYRASRFHAYEASLMVGQTRSADLSEWPYLHGSGRVLPGMAQFNTLLIGGGLGVSARLPTRLTPVVRVAAGVQRRSIFDVQANVSDSTFDTGDDRAVFDLTGIAGLGVEYRVSQSWSLGLGISTTHALALDGDSTLTSLEGMIHVGLH
jgi:hypothetical protein